MTMFSRAVRRQAIETTFADTDAIASTLGDVAVPADIAAWLGRLLTLSGVPFGYLVPDEAMLPPESIRFFRLDEKWVRALLDGAFSLGRNLTAEASGRERQPRPRAARPGRRQRQGRRPAPPAGRRGRAGSHRHGHRLDRLPDALPPRRRLPRPRRQRVPQGEHAL